MYKLLFINIFMAIFCLVSKVNAQTERNSPGRLVDAFPYPYSHLTFVQPRFDRQNLKGGAYFNSYVVRAAKSFKGMYHLKLDLPLANTNTSGCDVFGLSDIKLRLLHANPLHQQLYIGYGAEFTLPTATDKSLGSGKWQGRPELGMIYFLGSPDNIVGTVLFATDYRFDFAGSSDRSHISVLGIVPNVDFWAKKWYAGYYATWTYDFINEMWDIPLDVEFGYNIAPGFTLSAEYIQPLLKERTYNNEYAVKLRYLFK